jgi:hypothetical protein
VQRRDLTAAQRAIVAARALEQMPERRGRPEKDGKSSHNFGLSRDLVSKTFKVSDKSVQQAKAILIEAPDLAAQVESCATSLAAAYEELHDRRKQVLQKDQAPALCRGNGSSSCASAPPPTAVLCTPPSS